MSATGRVVLGALAAAGAEVALPGWAAPIAVTAVIALFQYLATRQVASYDEKIKALQDALAKETAERRARDHEHANDITTLRVSLARVEALQESA